MIVVFMLTMVCFLGVIYALFAQRMDTIGLGCIFGAKMFIASGFIIGYLFLLESYPTVCRATGLAFCMVLGRVGAFICPFLYDGLVMFNVHYAWFFVCMALAVTLAAFLTPILPRETKDAPLSDV